MTTTAPAPHTHRFHTARPTGLRRTRPWHRLAYIAWLLPRRLESLAALLEVPADGRVLDYGCAEQPYRHFFASSVALVGADLPGNPDADIAIAGDGTIPVDDGTFDAVLSTQVLEHVADPAIYLEECRRVLRPGGRLLLSTHGLMVYHPDPVDYWRWTGAGLEQIVTAAGMRLVHREGIMGLGAVGLQFVQDSMYHRLPRRLRAPFALLFQTLIALSDQAVPAGRRDGNALVFAVVAERPYETDGTDGADEADGTDEA
jgi:SAM-dependent methyltransferase